MAGGKAKKWGLIALVVLVVLIVGAVVGFRIAVGILRDRVVAALGPDSEIRELRIGWSALQIEGLRIKGGTGWPAVDALRVDRVVIVPSLRSFLSDQIQVSSITFVKPYLSALRTRGGKLQVVPSLLAEPAAEGPAGVAVPARTVAIPRITLEEGVLELFDATVAQPPLKIRLEQIQATVRDVVAPTLKGQSRFEITGTVKGVRRDGRMTISGRAEVATRDSSVKTQLRSVDLVALQPYLIKTGESRVQEGALDLDLQSEVRQNRLRASGTVTISDLQWAPARGAFDTFMGVPRAVVVNFLKNKGSKIEVNFTLEGDIDNPQFALNEAFATRLASAMAEHLGVSLQGVAEGVGGLGRQGVEAGGEAAKGLGGVLRKFSGGQQKP